MLLPQSVHPVYRKVVQAIVQQLNKAGGKDRKLDPRMACGTFGKLLANGEQSLKWLETNKDWCQIPDQVVDDLIVWGPPEKCREHIQRYVDNGVTVPVLNFIPVAPDASGRARQSLEMLRALAPAQA